MISLHVSASRRSSLHPDRGSGRLGKEYDDVKYCNMSATDSAFVVPVRCCRFPCVFRWQCIIIIIIVVIYGDRREKQSFATPLINNMTLSTSAEFRLCCGSGGFYHRFFFFLKKTLFPFRRQSRVSGSRFGFFLRASLVLARTMNFHFVCVCVYALKTPHS